MFVFQQKTSVFVDSQMHEAEAILDSWGLPQNAPNNERNLRIWLRANFIKVAQLLLLLPIGGFSRLTLLQPLYLVRKSCASTRECNRVYCFG